LIGRDNRPDRNFGSRQVAIPPENGSVLRSVEIKLEQHTMRILEDLAPRAGEKRTDGPMIRTVAHLHHMAKASKNLLVEGIPA
jgi:hypothetical protein